MRSLLRSTQGARWCEPRVSEGPRATRQARGAKGLRFDPSRELDGPEPRVRALHGRRAAAARELLLEAVEHELGVLGAGTRLGVVLRGKHGQLAVAQAFDGAVVRVDLGD